MKGNMNIIAVIAIVVALLLLFGAIPGSVYFSRDSFYVDRPDGLLKVSYEGEQLIAPFYLELEGIQRTEQELKNLGQPMPYEQAGFYSEGFRCQATYNPNCQWSYGNPCAKTYQGYDDSYDWWSEWHACVKKESAVKQPENIRVSVNGQTVYTADVLIGSAQTLDITDIVNSACEYGNFVGECSVPMKVEFSNGGAVDVKASGMTCSPFGTACPKVETTDTTYIAPATEPSYQPPVAQEPITTSQPGIVDSIMAFLVSVFDMLRGLLP